MNCKQYDQSLIERGEILKVSPEHVLRDTLIIALAKGATFQINDLFDGPRYQETARNVTMATRRRIVGELVDRRWLAKSSLAPYLYEVGQVNLHHFTSDGMTEAPTPLGG